MVISFIQKMHWEAVQGKGKSFSLMEFSISSPCVVYQMSPNFTSIWLVKSYKDYISNNISKIFKKLKKIRLAHKIAVNDTSLPVENFNFSTFWPIPWFWVKYPKKRGTIWRLLICNIAVLRILGLNSETPLFVGVFLPEHTWINPRNSLL